MKRFLALAALVLGLAACQTEPEGLNVNVGGEVDTTITVTIPDTETRAGGTNSAGSIFDNVNLGTEDDNKTMRYILKVYDANNNASENRQVAYSDGRTVNFDVRLVPNRHYSFVVWADYVESKDDTDFHYNTSDLTDITLKDDWNPMDETRDAFTGVYNTAKEDDKSKYNGSKVINITLTRPFAKLRVKTTDIKELTDLHITPAYATVEYKTEYRPAFNALVGEAKAKGTEKKTHTTVFPVATYTNESADLHNRTLFTDYFFANEGDAVSFILNVYEDAAGQNLIKSNNFNTDIAVNRNYLTTIEGNILTDGNNVKVDVTDAFENWQNPNNKPYYNEIVEVGNATDLQEAINESTENTTIVLGGNIDLGDLFGVTRAAATLPIVIPEDKVVALDLNGFNLTTPFVTGSTTNHAYAFENHGNLTIQDSKGNGQIIARGIFNYGTMTLKSGTINACDGNGGYGVRNYERAEFIMNGGSIVTSYEDGDAPKAGYDATTLRVDEGATATINGGTIDNISNYTFAIDNYGTTTVKGGTITSIHSTVSSYGTMTINGGSFTCNGLEGTSAHALVVWNGSNTTINGGIFDGKDNYNGFNVCASAGAEVNIYGGEFKKVHSGSLYGEGTINVMGGTFFDDPSARVVTGYKVAKNEEGNYTVTELVLNATFAQNDWSDIVFACENNRVPESWNVGDTKAMTIGGKDYQIRILGKNHDTYTAGGTAPLTFQIAEVYGAAPMNATQTNTTGWSGSKMRTETMAEILEVMPVKDAIKAVDKETLNGTRDGLETTSDKLFLLSEIEVNGSVYFSNNFAEGSRYAFFGDVDSMKLNATYWLRGPGKSNDIGYTQIIMSGYMANGSAEIAAGVVFGFCF